MPRIWQLLRKNRKIFETQYRAGSTTIHNGVMSQSGALQLAKKDTLV